MLKCLVPMVFAVWLHGYPDSTEQATGNIPRVLPQRDAVDARAPKRLRSLLKLPQPDWFSCKAARVKTGADAAQRLNPKVSGGCVVKALAKVHAGTVWQSELTHLNEEELLGFEYFLNPTDYFSLRVEAVLPVQENFTVTSSKSFVLRRPVGVVEFKDPSEFSVQLGSLTVPFWPYLPGVDLSRIALGSAGQAVSAGHVLANVWGLSARNANAESCLVVPLPEALLQMILQGEWKHIPCLGRWHPLLSNLPEPIQTAVGVPGHCPPEPKDGGISQAKVLDLLKKLQCWAPVLLQDDVNDQRKLELLGAVRWLANVRAALPGDHMTIFQSKLLYGSLFLVRCVLMTRLMPSYVNLKEVALESLSLLFPNLLKDSLEHLWNSKHLFPGEGSKHKMRLVLDVALLLWKRTKELAEGPFVRFAGADSSPQHGFNWLLSSTLSVRSDRMIEVFRVVQRMIAEGERRAQNSDHEVELPSEQSRSDHAFLLANVRSEHDMPVALGSGAEGTAHKCAGMLHKWALLVGHSDRLQEHCDSFFSFCSDMGAELGVGHFRVDGLKSLVPSWMQHEPMQCDLPQDCALPGPVAPASPDLQADFVMDLESLMPAGPAGAVPAVPEERPSPGPSQNETQDRQAWPPPANASDVMFLRNAISVPGLLHIVNNALVEVSSKLSHFDAFFEQLGEFEGLVTCGRLSRFVNYCVKPSPLASQADELLQRKFGRLYLKRWGEVVNFCKRLASFLPLIRCCWNERAYLGNVRGDEEDDTGERRRSETRFSPERFSAVLKDPMFFGYFDMILMLSGCIEQISQWAESCPCHGDLQLSSGFRRFENRGRHEAQTNFRRARRQLRSLFANQAETCVMRGKRLPELVADGLELVLANFSDLALTELMQQHRPHLSDADWATLVADFEHGRSHAELEFSLKLDWTRRLPWKLALLGHRDVAKARRDLRLVMRDFDSQSPELQLHHHSLTRHLLLKSGDMRRDMDMFVAGHSLQQLPCLEFVAACFRLVQVTERSFEAAHSILKRKVPPNAAGPVVSLSLRLHDLSRAIKIEASTLADVAAEFAKARRVKSIPGLMGLAAHPDLVLCREETWKLVKVLNKVLYRSDVSGQFPELGQVEAWHKRNKDKQQRQAEKLLPKETLSVTYENLRAKALHSHFLAVAEASPDAMFALPCEVMQGSEVGGEGSASLLRDVHARLTMSDTTSAGLTELTSDLALDPLSLPEPRPPLGSVLQARPHMPGPALQGRRYCYFKVLHTNPSRRRTMTLSAAAAGKRGRLHANDVAVSVHEEYPLQGADSPCLSLAPQVTEGGSTAQVLANLPQFMLFDDIRQGLLCSRSPAAEPSSDAKLLYSFAQQGVVESLDFRNVSKIATSLVGKEAFPGAPVWVDLPASADLQALVQAELLQLSPGHPEKCQLTGRGLAALTMFKPFGQFEAVSDITHDLIELPAPTSHELLQSLEEQGWSWERLPQKRKGAPALSYEIGLSPKVFRTSSVAVSPEYLRCLVGAEDLQTKYGVQRIPHGLSGHAYTQLLQGHVPPAVPLPLPAPLALEHDLALPDHPDQDTVAPRRERGARKRKQPARQDEAMRSECELSPAHSASSSDGESILQDLVEAMRRDVPSSPMTPPAAVAGGGPSRIDDQSTGSAVWNNEHEDPPGGRGGDFDPNPEPRSDAEAAPSELPALARASASRPDPERIEAAAADGSQFSWATFRYGAFRFTAKRPKAHAQWSWQAACPFHAKNSQTGCKKTMNVNPLTQERYDQVLACLKHWCNQARRFTRQRHHVGFNVGIDEHPALSMIESCVIPAAEAPGRVVNDEELDAQATATAAAAAAAKGNPAKAKAKARAAPKVVPKSKSEGRGRGGRGRGRSRGMGSRVLTEPPGPGDEAGSDPSSSESAPSAHSSSESSSSSTSESESS